MTEDKGWLVFGDKVRRAVNRAAGWVNVLTGFGTDRDKTTSNVHARSAILTDAQAEALYIDDDKASRACEALPEDAFKKGFNFEVHTKSDSTKVVDIDGHKTQKEIEVAEAGRIASEVKDFADAMDLTEKFVDGVIWGRLFGGAALFLGADDGSEDLSLPLNEKAIETFDHVNVIDKRYMSPKTWYVDPTSKNFGKPETYMITGDGVSSTQVSAFQGGIPCVHESRLIVFGGNRTPIRARQDNNGFEVSVLQKMHKILSDWGISWSALANLIQDANQGVFTMEGLIEAIASGDEDVIVKRMQMIDLSRSVARATVLDAQGEKFERQNFSWSGIKEPFQLLMLQLASAVPMPVTILMGQSPAGMDATGESDLKWWEATVLSAQERDYTPKLNRIFKLIMLAKEGPTGGKLPDSYSVSFPPIREMTEKEQAEIRELQSKTDKAYIEAAVVLPEEIAINRFGPGGYSTATTIDLTSRAMLLEGDMGGDGTELDPIEDPAAVGQATAQGADVQKTALNGAQVSSMVDVSSKVALGELTKESGVAILMAAFPTLTQEEANEIAGDKKSQSDPAQGKSGFKEPTPPVLGVEE
jgi:phage-related protein (TIGR01555 family)